MDSYLCDCWTLAQNSCPREKRWLWIWGTKSCQCFCICSQSTDGWKINGKSLINKKRNITNAATLIPEVCDECYSSVQWSTRDLENLCQGSLKLFSPHWDTFCWFLLFIYHKSVHCGSVGNVSKWHHTPFNLSSFWPEQNKVFYGWFLLWTHQTFPF